MMTPDEAIAYLTALPAFIPKQMPDGKPQFDLVTVSKLLHRLGDPQKALRYVHVAGTNGKGSTCAFLHQILTEAGYRTGLYTSPSVGRFTERIRVNRHDISQDALGRLTALVKKTSEAMEAAGDGTPSEFEIVIAIAFLYFLEEKCDIVVLETGLGGEFDATNVIPAPLVSIITTISYDHTTVLGDTLEKIASAKAGIIKEGTKVLLFPVPPEADAVFAGVCRKKKVPLYDLILPERLPSSTIRRQSFLLGGSAPRLRRTCAPGPGEAYASGPGGASPSAEEKKVWSIALAGPYQTENAAAALEAAALLREDGFVLPDSVLSDALLHTRWPARFEVLAEKPWIIVDGGHNKEGSEKLKEALETWFPGRKAFFITGVLSDKDYPAMMAHLMPVAEYVWTVAPSSPRALPAEKLAAFLNGKGVPAEACSSYEEAYAKARGAISRDDILVSFGSLYFAGAMRQLVLSGLHEATPSEDER